MKRKAESQITGTKAKIPKNISAVFFTRLFEVIGTSVDRHALEKSKLTTLRSFCSEFHLTVVKSGRTKDGRQKYGLKKDYVESIIVEKNKISTTTDDVIPDLPRDYVDPIVTDDNTHDSESVQTVLARDANPMEESSTQTIEVRVFRNAKDYRTTAIHTLLFPYTGSGLHMTHLTTHLGLNGIYKLVDPLNYKTAYVREDYIDHIIIELHLKRQGYLRLIPAINN